MANRLTALLVSATIAATTLAPSLAIAEERGRRGGGGYEDNGPRGDFRRDGGGGYRGERGGRGDWGNGRSYRGDDRRHHHDDDDDDEKALVAGVVGLVIGAAVVSALASNHQRQQQQGYGYDDGYGPPPPQAAYSRRCIVKERQWDPYVGRTLMIEREVPC